MLGCYNGSILAIHKGVGDKKRVATHLFNLQIGQVVGIPLLGDTANQLNDGLFIKHQRIFVYP